jgi:glyoxylase I family protein
MSPTAALISIPSTSFAHLRLTVTDIARSRQFYEHVFGWPIYLEMPKDADDATREQLGFLFGGVIYDVGDHRVGLGPGAVDKFDENRTGLDHLAFAVGAKSELDDLAQHLDQLGIAHGPIKDLGVLYLLEFRDPDSIALEITAPQ